MEYVKKRAVQLCAVPLVFVLAACGPNVDTALAVDGNFSGTRVMACGLFNRGREGHVKGGARAAGPFLSADTTKTGATLTFSTRDEIIVV